MQSAKCSIPFCVGVDNFRIAVGFLKVDVRPAVSILSKRLPKASDE